MGKKPNGMLLLAPIGLAFLVLLALPFLQILNESFRTFVPGRIGSSSTAPLTLFNYVELLHAAYLHYFFDTFRLGFIASTAGVAVAFPIAYFVARTRSRPARRFIISSIIMLMFLSGLVRVYALAVTFGPAGYMRQIAAFLGLNANGPTVTEAVVVAGLLHYIIPMSVLALFGTIQNVNPRLAEAAMALGASRWYAHVSITVPLSMPGILSAFLISFTISISAFVVPMILGKGRVLFVSNLIYARFSEASNYPSGAAIAVIMTLLSLVTVYGTSKFSSRNAKSSS
jgi:ABC-type spermidine/putrescine transport system permease subunit I